MTDVSVRAVAPDVVFLTLRRDLLRAGHPVDSVAFDGDHHDAATHWGAFDPDGRLVGIASFLPWSVSGELEPGTGQLRGMAVVESRRRRGVGRALLETAEERDRSIGRVDWWANARIGALSFYEALGWTIDSGEFDIPVRIVIENRGSFHIHGECSFQRESSS